VSACLDLLIGCLLLSISRWILTNESGLFDISLRGFQIAVAASLLLSRVPYVVDGVHINAPPL